MRLAVRHAKNLSLISLDIKSFSENFKALNEQHGQEFSDITLTAVVTWIKESIRSSDTVFRIGSEKFVILLSDTDLAGAELLAERIRNTIELHPLAYDMVTIKITANLAWPPCVTMIRLRLSSNVPTRPGIKPKRTAETRLCWPAKDDNLLTWTTLRGWIKAQYLLPSSQLEDDRKTMGNRCGEHPNSVAL